MFILICENVSDKIRGEITKYCYELKPYIFISNASAKIKDFLWGKLKEESKNQVNLKAEIIIINKMNESGFTTEKINEVSYNMENFDGLPLITKSKSKILVSWKSYKAKENKQLYLHMYESGMIAKYLCNNVFNKTIKEISDMTETDITDMKSFICFIVALHDIGKMHKEFQNKINKDVFSCKYFRHEIYSEKLLEKLLSEEPFIDDISRKLASKICSCHHQNKIGRNETVDYLTLENSPITEDEMMLYKFIRKEFIPGRANFNIKLYNKNKEILDIVCFTITNIMILSDWISSNSVFGDLKTDFDFADIGEYRDYLYNECKRICKENHIETVEISEFQKDELYDNIFGRFKRLNNMQEVAVKCSDSIDFKRALFAASTGGGKTEASIYCALKNFGGGIYFATPTSATAQSLLHRVRDILERCGFDHKTLLYTGTSYLDPDNVLDIENEILAEEHLKMLYPFAVGTIDQLLMAVRKIQYGGLKALGLCNKTIIIDEIHDNDYFQLEIIEKLLEYCDKLGIRVIMLSATVPTNMKRRLLGVENVSELYPSISFVGRDNKLTEIECPLEKTESVGFDFCDDINVKVQQLLDTTGGCICIRLNTISKVREKYKELKKIYGDSIEIIKLHGDWMTQEKKDEISKRLHILFGKDRSNRPQKAIVIATQVIEQSLDIDFDYGITDLAPIGMIIQFMGRIWRHRNPGTIRDKINIEKRLFVVKSLDDKIYNREILQNTLGLLERLPQLNIPADNQKYVNEVWDAVESESVYKSKSEYEQFLANIGTIDSFNNVFHLYQYCDKYMFDNKYKCSRNIKIEKVSVAAVEDDVYNEIESREKITREEAKEILYKNTVSMKMWEFNSIKNISHLGENGKCIRIKGLFFEIYKKNDLTIL